MYIFNQNFEIWIVQNCCGIFPQENLEIPVKKDILNLKKNQTYDIILYVILFVLFLALNRDKPYYNILNSLGAMIFCFIKLLEIYLRKWLEWCIKKFQRKFCMLWFSQNIKKYTANDRWDQMQ